MGYDIGRFRDEVNKEFICSICTGVLEDPVITPECEHAFCRVCISDWLNVKQQCPIDNSVLKLDDLRTVPRIIKNVLAEFLISCDYASNGCGVFLKLGCLNAHVKQCAYNPQELVPGEKNGGDNKLESEMKELQKCFDVLKLENQEIKEKFTKSTVELKQELNKMKETSELTKAILDEIKSLRLDVTLIKKIYQSQVRQYKDNSLCGDWWKHLQYRKIRGSAFSRVSNLNGLDQLLLTNTNLLKDLHKLVLCECHEGSYHSCGIEKLESFELRVRFISLMVENSNADFYLILKLDNPHVPIQFFMLKCGYLFKNA